MSQLDLYLFGPPRLELDGTPIHITRRKAMALLAYLAVSGQEHSRDSLATLLWPENDQSSARTELSRTISVLNRTLGRGWLFTDRETVRLKKRDDPLNGLKFWLDVDEFEQKNRCCETHDHRAAVVCSDCLESLEAAASLYNDAFMAGFSLKDCPAYDEWQFFQEQELRTKLTDILMQLSSYYANTLEYESAINHTRHWLQLDPLHEPAHRQQMTLFAKSGQQAAALRQYETCLQLLADELGVEPSEETRELYQRIRVSGEETSALQPSSNLPVQPTPFIGRVSESAEIQAKLKQDDCRLLTLLGPGGSGKTRLAIEAAGRLQYDFKHGIHFINLASIQDTAQIASTIATVLGFTFFGEGTPEEQLLDYLRNKEMLLILDNFEHLLAGARFANQIIKIAPTTKILATSRTSLAITGETIYPVMGMAYPKRPTPLKTIIERYSAVRLFESTAKRRQPTFELNDDNLDGAIQVCALLEGMPLGIVLAGNWVTVLTPAEIASEIEQGLAFLDTDMQDLPRRQRGMRSVFNYSWQLLQDDQRDVMRALSVFRGGLTRDSAHKVAGASLLALKGLTDHSMLYRTASGRYEIHELLRQFAAERLAMDAVVETAVRDKHSNYFLQALTSWHNDLQGPRQGTASQEMMDEIDNIRDAWRWAVDRTEVQMTVNALYALCYFYDQNYFHLEGQRFCQMVVEKLTNWHISARPALDDIQENHPAQIERLKVLIGALIWGGWFNNWLGNADLARIFLQKSLALLENNELPEWDRDFLKAPALHTLSYVIRVENRSESIRMQRESLKLFRSLELDYYAAYVLLNLTQVTATRAERIKLLEESIAVRRNLGDLRGIAESLTVYAKDVMGACQFVKAEEMLKEALPLFKEIAQQHGIMESQRLLGVNYLLQGKFQKAQIIHQNILSMHNDLESTISRAYICWTAGYADLYMGDYDNACSQAQDSLTLCRNKHLWPYTLGSAQAKSILGRVALARRDDAEALRCFDESYSSYQILFEEHMLQNMGEENNFGQVLACLGYVERRLNQITQARRHFLEALRLGMQYEHFLPLIQALLGIALLFNDQGEVERAVELYALASTFGIVANSKWFADIAGDEIAAMAEKLPVDAVEAAKTRGHQLDLWKTAENLLVELEELGWGGSAQ